MTPRHPAQGSALIISLILLVVIGLTSAVVMRSTIASEQSTNSLRLEGTAQQYAEMALRYCESEMGKDPGDRVAALQSIDADSAGDVSTGKWTQTTTWVGTSLSALDVPDDWLSSGSGSVKPVTKPQCVVEKVNLDSKVEAFLVTARGHSPDFEADPTTGRARRGSSVWLQSFLVIE